MKNIAALLIIVLTLAAAPLPTRAQNNPQGNRSRRR